MELVTHLFGVKKWGSSINEQPSRLWLSVRQDERNERNANRECQAHPPPGCWDYLSQGRIMVLLLMVFVVDVVGEQMKTDCDNLIFSMFPP